MKIKSLEPVMEILENRPKTKDCDLALFVSYMNINHGANITKEQYDKMLAWPSFASIIRKRRYIQNNLKQHLPSPTIAKSRGQDESKYRSRYWPVYE